MAEPRNRYSTVSLILHWLIAALVVTQLTLIALYVATKGQPSAAEYLQLHKSTGLSILVLTLGRLGWRLANPAIALPSEMPRWQRLLARSSHVLFYILLIALPLGGWAASSAAGRPITWFGLFNWPLLPLPQDRGLAGSIMEVHELAGLLMVALIVLHVAGALKHHFVDRDNVLHRMIPWIPRRP